MDSTSWLFNQHSTTVVVLQYKLERLILINRGIRENHVMFENAFRLISLSLEIGTCHFSIKMLMAVTFPMNLNVLFINMICAEFPIILISKCNGIDQSFSFYKFPLCSKWQKLINKFSIFQSNVLQYCTVYYSLCCVILVSRLIHQTCKYSKQIFSLEMNKQFAFLMKFLTNSL